MTKILVTGGAGFIGAHLTNQLIKKKHKVLVVDNLTTIGGIKFIHKKCTFIKGDLLDEKTLKKIKSWKPKIIFHTAAQSAGESAYDNPKYDFLSNGSKRYSLITFSLGLRSYKEVHLCRHTMATKRQHWL